MDQALVPCTEGVGIWQWASNDQVSEPDVVMGCCGDTPTLEVLAAVAMLREHPPTLKIRVVNVVDMMKLQSQSEHQHGLSDADYDSLFTTNKHIVFGFHGYASLVHRLTYRRTNRILHVRGYKEEGTITTAFDMPVQDDIDTVSARRGVRMRVLSTRLDHPKLRRSRAHFLGPPVFCQVPRPNRVQGPKNRLQMIVSHAAHSASA